MLEAAEYADTLQQLGFAYSNTEVYDSAKLLVSFQMSDEENPVDEDSFYVVSPSGTIGLCQDGEEIDWLFLSSCAVDEDLPATLSSASQKQILPELRLRRCSRCPFLCRLRHKAVLSSSVLDLYNKRYRRKIYCIDLRYHMNIKPFSTTAPVANTSLL